MKKEKLKYLLEQIRDIIKTYSNDSALLIIMFFCLRIMILRTKKQLFSEMFSLIWPVLYYLMISILSDEGGLRDPNLKLATLKLIEMLCLIDYEGFYLYYWNMGIDSSEANFYNLKNDAEDVRPFVSEFPYISFISKIIQKNVGYNYITFKNKLDSQYFERKKGKREIIIKSNNVKSDVELSFIAFELMDYISVMNTVRLETDWDEVNQVIVDDFISLNDFISK